MSCAYIDGMFFSSCAPSVVLSNCSDAFFNAEYRTLTPVNASRPPHTLGQSLSIINGGGVPYALKGLKLKQTEYHERVSDVRVRGVLPFAGRCHLGLHGQPVLLSPWIDGVPCSTILRSPSPSHSRETLLRDAVDFFLDMVLTARLVDIDRAIDGWERAAPQGTPATRPSFDRNVLCRDCTAAAAAAAATGAEYDATGGTALATAATVTTTAAAGHRGHPQTESRHCTPLLHHDFDAAVELDRPESHALRTQLSLLTQRKRGDAGKLDLVHRSVDAVCDRRLAGAAHGRLGTAASRWSDVDAAGCVPHERRLRIRAWHSAHDGT
jgi:hypothetical protein